MATDAENLATAKSNFLAKLAEISVSPKPSYVVDGQSVSWTEYYKFLTTAIADINALTNDETPFEIHTTGFSP